MKPTKGATPKETDSKKGKFTYADLLRKHSIIRAILLAYEKKELSAELKYKVMDVRFALKDIHKRYDELVKDGHDDLKPEGFDEQRKEAAGFEEAMHKKNPDAKELTSVMSSNLTKEEQELKDKYDAFMPVFSKWNKECEDFDSGKLVESVDYKEVLFTKDEYKDILNVNTSEKYSIQVDVKIDSVTRMVPVTLPSSDFMEIVHEEFVE